MSDTGRPGPERPAGPPTPPISNWQAMQQKPPTASIPATGDADPSAGPRAGIPAAFAAQQAAPATEPDPAPATSGRPR